MTKCYIYRRNNLYKYNLILCLKSSTGERLTPVDIPSLPGYSGMNIYAQRNSSLEGIGWDTFVRSFHWGTWLAILTLLGVMTVGLWVIVRHQADEDQHFAKRSNVAFILFSCLVQQGLECFFSVATLVLPPVLVSRSFFLM